MNTLQFYTYQGCWNIISSVLTIIIVPTVHKV